MKDRSGQIGLVVICLFATPFALFGLFAMGTALKQLAGAPGNTPFWYPLIFGVVFCAIGFGLIALVLIGRKRYNKQMDLQAQHPTEPWLWRVDWASGRVNSETRGTMIGGWLFAIFWNVVSIPVAWLAVPGAVKQKGLIVYVVLIFPVLGVYLLIRAIRQTLAFVEFGKTYFEMASVPGVIGRELKGNIQAHFPHSPDRGIHLRISSVHKVTTGSGDSQTTNESILWRDEADLRPEQLYAGPMGATIPVSFRIPVDAHPTEKISPRDQFVWILEAMADVPGVDYHDVFEIPVFRTAASSQAEPSRNDFSGGKVVATRPERLTIDVHPTTEGTEFFFPAGRNKGFATSTTVFAAIFSIVTIFLTRVKVPFIFPLVFGFFSVLLVSMAVSMWMSTTRVVIGDRLKLQSGFLGSGKVREIAFSDIASIDDKIMAQQGGATGTPYYNIILKLKDGKSLTLGKTIPSKQETEWLMSEMRRLIEPRAKALGVSSIS